MLPQLVVGGFFVVKRFLHLSDYVQIVRSQRLNTLQHALDVLQGALLLVVLDLLPLLGRQVVRLGDCVQSLGQPVILEESALLLLYLILSFILLI